MLFNPKIRPTSKGFAGLIFIPLSVIFGMVVRLRLFLFSLGFPRQKKTGALKVISVGNITAGGTGKTPVTIMLAKMVKNNVAIVSRGYGRKSKEPVQIVADGNRALARYPDAGDEALLCATELKTVPVICSPKRVSGLRVADTLFGAKTVILDDAFSHLSAHRDKNILLLDALNPFGGGRMLPAGTLREPLSSISRADCVLITRANQTADDELEKIKNDVKKFAGRTIPVFLCDINASALFGPDGSKKPPQFLSGKKVRLLSGLGSPGQFEKSVAALGAVVCGHSVFPDHHQYSEEELNVIVASSVYGGELLLTTGKDLVRVPDGLKNRFHVLSVEAVVREAEEFDRWLSS